MDHVASIRMSAKKYADDIGADYIFYLDADTILMNPDTLKLPIVAPMLNITGSYSNFWAGMDANGYYERSDESLAIRDRALEGGLSGTHGALGGPGRCESGECIGGLTFDHHDMADTPRDDIIVFALSAKANNVLMYVANTAFFGYLPIPATVLLAIPCRTRSIIVANF